MSGTVSINGWGWLARPKARIENNLLVAGDDVRPYRPGEHIKDILNAIQRFLDEETALEFVRQWGMLGLGQGESVADIISFAQRIKYLSEVKRLFALCREDKLAGAYETREWLSSLSPEQSKILNVDIDFLKQIFNKGGYGSGDLDFYQYVLDIILKSARASFSHRSQRGIWVQLYTSPIAGHPEGFPIIQFDGLFRFIEYMLLVDGGPSPKRCADPKCGQLFFPTKAGQEYCPPPPGVNRSRCENRHGTYLRRHGIKKPKGRMVNGQGKAGRRRRIQTQAPRPG